MLVAQAFAAPRDHGSQQLLGLAKLAERCQTLDLGDRFGLPAKAFEDEGAQLVGGEGNGGVRRAEVGALLHERQNARPLLATVDLGERLVVMAKAVEVLGARVAGSEGKGVRRADVTALLREGENARPLLGAVDLGERLVVVAEAVEDFGAQPAGGEG
jgi:CTP synthase (UTP-ammonia lyase)